MSQLAELCLAKQLLSPTSAPDFPPSLDMSLMNTGPVTSQESDAWLGSEKKSCRVDGQCTTRLALQALEDESHC